MKKKFPHFFVGATIFFWASGAAVAKLLLRNLSNFQVLFFTSFFATIALFFAAFFAGKLKLIKNLRPRDFFVFAKMGFCGIFLYYIFLYAGLARAPAAEIFIVNYSWPIWTVIFSIFILREKFTLRRFYAILCGFCGVAIIFLKENFFSIENFRGHFCAILAAIFYGFFSAAGKKLKYDKILAMFFYFLFGFFFVAPIAIFRGEIPILNFFEFAGILWLGVFCSGAGFLFWFFALQNSDTAKMANLIFLTPFFSLVFIHFLVGEKIAISSVAGLFLIIFGIFLQNFSWKKK